MVKFDGNAISLMKAEDNNNESILAVSSIHNSLRPKPHVCMVSKGIFSKNIFDA